MTRRIVLGLRLALFVTSVLLAHAAILRGAYWAAAATGSAASVLFLLMSWWSEGRRALRTPWIGIVIVLLAAQIATWLGYHSAVALVLAPSVIINAALLILFGQTLLPGREPLITRFRRLEHGEVTPMFASYTRNLTIAWTLLFSFGVVVSLMAVGMGDVALWSWVSLILLPAMTGALFLGEHVYRAARYGAEGRASPLDTLRLIARPEAWSPGPLRQDRVRSAGHD
jgi:uncharacterized membrane protein